MSDLEINIKERIYANDAFKMITEEYKDTERYFIIGADNFINIMNWKNGEELINKYNYIILERDTIDIKKYIEENLKINKDKIYIVSNEKYKKCSSTAFRDKYRTDKTYNEEIISDNVLDYIIENDLYSNNK